MGTFKMLTKNLIFSLSEKEHFEHAIHSLLETHSYKSVLVQVFIGSDDVDAIHKTIDCINNIFPKEAVIIGCTTAGEILDGKMYDNATVVATTLFEKSTLKNAYLSGYENHFEMGQEIARHVIEDDTQAAIIFADGLTINGELLIKGFSTIPQSNPLLAGGMAADDNRFQRTWQFHQNHVFNNGVVAVSLNGTELRAFNSYNLSWQELGPTLEITRSEHGRVYEINHLPIKDVYEQYLGKNVVDHMPDSTIEFPLIIQGYEIPVARSMIYDYVDGSIQFAGNIEKGELVRFAVANTNSLIAARSDMKKTMQAQGAESIFLYSCTARKAFLGKQLEDEFTPINEITSVSGFFTYGEVYHFNNSNQHSCNNTLLNVTSTVLGLSESPFSDNSKVTAELAPSPETLRKNISNDTLIHLVNVTSQELELQIKENLKTLRIHKQYDAAISKAFIMSKTDPYGNITFVNENFENISGYSADELIGNNHNLVRHPDTPESIFKDLWSTIQSNKIWTGTIQNRAKNGDTYIVNTTIAPIANIDGQVTEYLSLRQDITEQERQKQVIINEQSKTRLILDNQKSLVLMTNKLSRKVVDANHSSLEFLGCKTLGEFHARYGTISNTFQPGEAFLQKTMNGIPWFQYALENPEAEHKVLMPSAAGELHTFAVYISTLSDNSVFFVSNFVDITTLEEARNKALKAEKIQADFLANMSHELRTPLNGILGFTSLLASTELQPKQQKYVDVLESSTQHLLAVVNDILDISKIQRGEVILVNQANIIRSDLDSVLQIFIPSANNKEINFIIELSPKLPDCLSYDRLRLHQVLTNLISNAIKFTPNAGQVRVSVYPTSITEINAHICFSIQDTGIGIPADKQGLIFESFKQASSSTTRDYGGTGLGLSIASQLVNSMGGNQIELQSEENKGSNFFFVLPLEICQPEKTLAEALRSLRVGIFNTSTTQTPELFSFLHRYGVPFEAYKTCESECSTAVGTYDIIFVCSIDTFNQVAHTFDPSTLYIFFTPAPTALRSKPNVEEILNVTQNPSLVYNLLVEYIVSHSKASITQGDESFNGKVLIVEDNEVNQILMTEVFNGLDINFDIANNGLEAIEKFKNSHYDVVLMDINMPKMGGEEAITHIQSYEREKNLKPCPIIALTANVLPDQIIKYKTLGFIDHLAKPLEISKLEFMLRTLAKPSRNMPVVMTPLVSFDQYSAAKALGLPDQIYTKLLVKMVGQMDSKAPLIEQALEDSDFAALHKLSHDLYGALSNLRIENIADSIRVIEHLSAVESSIEDIKVQYQSYSRLCKQFKTTLG